MLKSIIAAAFMTTVFTFVTVSAVSITDDQVLAGKKEDKKKKKKDKVEKVGAKKGDRLFSLCLQAGGSIRTSSSGANIRCCKNKKCITCPTTASKPTCKKRWKALKNIDKPGLNTGSGGTQLAPAKTKPKKTRPSSTGTMNIPMNQYKMAPLAPKEFLILKNAQPADKPKTGPAINKNQIQ